MVVNKGLGSSELTFEEVRHMVCNVDTGHEWHQQWLERINQAVLLNRHKALLQRLRV